MDYHTSVLVIYGSVVEHVGEFLKEIMKDFPRIRKGGENMRYDMDDSDSALLYIERYLGAIDKKSLVIVNDMVIVYSFSHVHSVPDTKTPVRRIKEPTAKRKQAFGSWCAKYKLPRPGFMTVVLEDYDM